MATRHVRGANVQVDDDGGSAYADVGCVFAMSFPPLMRGTADVTCMNSTGFGDEDFYREFIKGFKDAGEPTFKFRFNQTDYATMKGIFEDNRCDTMPSWKFIFGICPDDQTTPFFTFKGIITKLDMPEKSIDGENTWECDVTIKISGATVFDAA